VVILSLFSSIKSSSYHIKQNPWARFGGSAPSRNIVPFLDYIRTYYGIK